MSLFVKQTETRSQLQEKLAKELQERAKNKPQPYDQPDGVMDSEYLKSTKQTTSLAWIWIVLGVAAIVAVIWLLVATA